MKLYSMIAGAAILLLFGCRDESGLSSNGRSSTITRGIELKFIRAETAISALKQVFPDKSEVIEFTAVESNSITIHSNDVALLDRASTLIHEIDQPSGGPPTKWVPLATLDLDRAATHLKGLKPDESFQAIPEPRTKRMFLMGTRLAIDHATEILQKMEAEQVGAGQPTSGKDGGKACEFHHQPLKRVTGFLPDPAVTVSPEYGGTEFRVQFGHLYPHVRPWTFSPARKESWNLEGSVEVCGECETAFEQAFAAYLKIDEKVRRDQYMEFLKNHPSPAPQGDGTNKDAAPAGTLDHLPSDIPPP